MMVAQSCAKNGLLSTDVIRETIVKGIADKFAGQKVLVLIPDHTRSLPLPFLFRTITEILHNTKQLDFMVALGTHPPLSKENLCQLVGITLEERSTTYENIGLFNHNWNDPLALARIGRLDEAEIRVIAGKSWHPSLGGDVDVRINQAALNYDQILILGPTFPHEVVGYSGGAKYLFPGISGPEMINATHWLGALSGVTGTIGIKDTPVRAMIHAAAMLKTPVTLVALVVEEHGLCGVYIGDLLSAWSAAADLSAQRQIQWVEQPFQKVISCTPSMYDELWTAAKAMYKLEPAVAMGGEVVIYAPHLKVVSRVFGDYIYEIGYHILPYFLANWERFRHIPLGVLAHSTHLRGSGFIEGDIERPNVHVTLASQIPSEDCTRLNLGYFDPNTLDLNKWQGRENEGIIVVPRAGEILFRLKGEKK